MLKEQPRILEQKVQFVYLDASDSLITCYDQSKVKNKEAF